MDVYSSTQTVRIAPLSHVDDGLLTPMFARRTSRPLYLETLARDLAGFLAGTTQHEVLCVIRTCPVSLTNVKDVPCTLAGPGLHK